MKKRDQPAWPSHVFDVGRHPQVALWMTDRARIDPDRFLRLAGHNEKELRRLYGKPVWSKNTSRGATYVWPIQAHSLSFLVQSGTNGTTVLVRTPVPPDEYLSDPRVGVGIVHFLDDLTRQLMEV